MEYKGKVWSEMKDSDEKRDLGAVWESRSNGTCLFIIPNGNDLEAIGKKIQPLA
jgi:type III restriction enzyme